MKTTLTACLFALLLINARAQEIPNNGFESWENFGNYENPTSWNTPNQYTALASVVVVSKSEDAAAGSFSAKLETKTVFGSFVSPGLITLADFVVDIIGNSFSITGGIAMHERPVKIRGIYKYTAVEHDSALLQAYNYKFLENGERDTLGIAVWYGQPAANWTPFEVDMEYDSALIPDTLNIVIMSSSDAGFIPGSVLMVDSLTLELQTGMQVSLTNDRQLRIYPNPVSDWLSIESQLPLRKAELIISDASGRETKRMALNSRSTTINVSDLPAGMYDCSITEGNTRLYRQSIIIR
ncbi:MAG: T9SS type A sorting domain-containing protein [Bacteroidetes bacterium]|nr:T9SS type A sorting domain-containing protein [Bacteroidota bacterium]